MRGQTLTRRAFSTLLRTRTHRAAEVTAAPERWSSVCTVHARARANPESKLELFSD